MGEMFFVSLQMMKRVCTALIITLFFIVPVSGQDKAPEGRLVNRTYEDKKGIKRYITEIVINDLLMLGEKKPAQTSLDL